MIWYDKGKGCSVLSEYYRQKGVNMALAKRKAEKEYCSVKSHREPLVQGYVDKSFRVSNYRMKSVFRVPAMICKECLGEGRESAYVDPKTVAEIEQNLVPGLNFLFDRRLKKSSVLPEEMFFSYTEDDAVEENNGDENAEADFSPERYEFLLRRPERTFEKIVLHDDVKNEILEALESIELRDFLLKTWRVDIDMLPSKGLSILFSGPSGTGKTVTAEAMATELGKSFLEVNYAHLESKYVGEMNKNLVALFELARKSDALIFFDEADSILGRRLSNVTQSADHGVNMCRSVMLTELEKHDDIVVFATNLSGNIDPAFRRRIFTSIVFQLPGEEEREKLWKLYIPDHIPVADDVKWEECVEKSAGFSCADIQTAATKALFLAAKRIINSDISQGMTINDIFNGINSVLTAHRIISRNHEEKVE